MINIKCAFGFTDAKSFFAKRNSAHEVNPVFLWGCWNEIKHDSELKIIVTKVLFKWPHLSLFARRKNLKLITIYKNDFHIKFTRKCNFFHDLFNNKANQDEKQLMKGYTIFFCCLQTSQRCFFSETKLKNPERKTKTLL